MMPILLDRASIESSESSKRQGINLNRDINMPTRVIQKVNNTVSERNKIQGLWALTKLLRALTAGAWPIPLQFHDKRFIGIGRVAKPQPLPDRYQLPNLCTSW